jgi:hypothetical protein
MPPPALRKVVHRVNIASDQDQGLGDFSTAPQFKRADTPEIGGRRLKLASVHSLPIYCRHPAKAELLNLVDGDDAGLGKVALPCHLEGEHQA